MELLHLIVARRSRSVLVLSVCLSVLSLPSLLFAQLPKLTVRPSMKSRRNGENEADNNNFDELLFGRMIEPQI